MHDFPRLLLNASMTMGTPLAVAKVLGVQPQLVYRWMAELERPSQSHVEASRLRLKEAFVAKHAKAVHPRRRASDRPAKLYLAVSAS